MARSGALRDASRSAFAAGYLEIGSIIPALPHDALASAARAARRIATHGLYRQAHRALLDSASAQPETPACYRL